MSRRGVSTTSIDIEGAPIRLRLNKLEGVRIDTGETPSSVTFDVDVKMDEESRTNDELTVSFLLTIGTKPTLSQFEVGGIAIITGGRRAFDAALEVDPVSNVPRLLHTIYQRAFTSLFVISSLLDTPYPPPDLLHSPTETRDFGAEVGAEAAAVAQQTA